MRSRIQGRLEATSGTEFALGALTRVLSRETVATALATHGKVAKRTCKLPPELVTWLVVAMGLFRSLSIQSVLARVVEGLRVAVRFDLAELPHPTSIAEARDRLGWEVMREIFNRLATTLAGTHEPQMRWREFVVRALDGCTFTVPDTPANDTEFGRPTASPSAAKCAYPQMRAVFVIGVFTHIVTHAIFAGYRESELALASRLADTVSRDTLLLMDRLYHAYAWLAGLLSREVPFIVRAKIGKNAAKPKQICRLTDGSTLVRFSTNDWVKRKNPGLPEAITLRMIKYQAKGFRSITLLTSLLSAKEYPAAEIGALYHDRWEVELSCREIKTHQAAEPVVFRTKTPDRVRQEAYGLLIAYNCVRGLMAEAAATRGVQPRRLSFVDCLERIKAAVILFGGDAPDDLYARLVVSLATRLLPPRREGRRYPRVVKHRVSKWPRKRVFSKGHGRSQVAR
jgi:hypothetical protein